MTEALHLAAVEFRNIIFATETGEFGISNYNTQQLPDGAMAYSVASGIAYRLHKSQSGSAITGSQLPGAGGGLWVAVSSISGSAFAHWTRSTAPEVAATSTDWGALGSAANRYVGLGSVAFTTNTTTGVVTYSGAISMNVLVTVQLALRPTTADKVFQLAISLNGALIGTATSPDTQAIQTVINGDLGNLVTFQLFVGIDAGDTFQPVLKVGATTDNTDVQKANMMIQPAGL